MSHFQYLIWQKIIFHRIEPSVTEKTLERDFDFIQIFKIHFLEIDGVFFITLFE